ncbi:MAG: hypothetical protein KAS35_02480 [Candidatus Marinimicrobia bacterium]|nr:hypothetical protein [Candidatus Neomarinimicrobiota bacterium]
MKVVLRDYTPYIDFEEVFSFTKEILGLLPLEEAREELNSYPKHNLCS